ALGGDREGGDAAGGVDGEGHPFTAPVRPPTMRRSNRLKKISAGSIDSEVYARTRAVSTEYCDAKFCTPSGSVNSAWSLRMNSGSMYPFQAPTNARMPTVITPGRLSGSTMRQKKPSRE